jgi:serine protease Do
MTRDFIKITTCENQAASQKETILKPQLSKSEWLFSLYDPFNIRKAIVPIFSICNDGFFKGAGTAFAVNNWGNFLTADHVIAEAREQVKINFKGDGSYSAINNGTSDFVIILSPGVVFGTVNIPDHFILPVTACHSPVVEVDDPLAKLRGEPSVTYIDISFLKTTRPQSNTVHHLPLKSAPTTPSVGDRVVAIGYPGIETFSGGKEGVTTISNEGMMAGYGKVLSFHPDGPVLTEFGEVVGIVSRSLLPDDASDRPGIAWATWLNRLAPLNYYQSSLSEHTHWRKGWGVIVEGKLVLPLFDTCEEALRTVEESSITNASVQQLFWKIGTDAYQII